MFKEHQPLIAQHGQTAAGFADIVTFVIATQNQYFYRVGEIVEEVSRVGFEGCKYLTASQKRGIAYARLHGTRLLDSLQGADVIEQVRILIEIPHIGIVKGGFILQMVYGKLGCLDRHNLRAAGLAANAFNRIPQSTEALSHRLHIYAEACTAMGTPEELWNGWCRLIAANYPEQFLHAEDVSFKHVVWTHATSREKKGASTHA
jgi:hypothetical protein